MKIVLLGDQVADCQLFLRNVLTLKDNLILKSLLDRVTFALHQEIHHQPHRSHSKDIPRFSTLKELIERHYASCRPNPALESAFLCLAQLSHFVWLVFRHERSYAKC